MGHDSLQRYTRIRVPSIAYASAGDCSFREDSQPKPSVRTQFFRVRELPLVHKRPIPRNALRSVPSKGQRLTEGDDEACAYVTVETRFRRGRHQRVRVKAIGAYDFAEYQRKTRKDVLFVFLIVVPDSSEEGQNLFGGV